MIELVTTLGSPAFPGLVQEEFVHDSHESLDDSLRVLTLQFTLTLLTVHQEMFEKIMEQLHCKHVMVQIRRTPQSLLEDSQQG